MAFQSKWCIHGPFVTLLNKVVDFLAKLWVFLLRGGTSAPGELPLGTGLCIIVVNYIVLFLAREIYLAVNVANCITLFVYYFFNLKVDIG